MNSKTQAYAEKRSPYLEIDVIDYLSDTGFISLSYHSMGVFFKLLMFGFQTGGYFRTAGDGEAIKREKLICFAFQPQEEFDNAFDELLEHGLIERAEDGSYFFPHLIRHFKGENYTRAIEKNKKRFFVKGWKQ